MTAEESPEVRGLKLGQSYEVLKTRDSYTRLAATPDEIGLLTTHIFKREVDDAMTRGVDLISLKYLDGKLASIQIRYSRDVRWESDAHFAAAIAEQLSLPTNGWQSLQGLPVLNCNGFFIKAGNASLGGRLHIERTDLESEIIKRKAALEQKKRTEFKP